MWNQLMQRNKANPRGLTSNRKIMWMRRRDNSICLSRQMARRNTNLVRDGRILVSGLYVGMLWFLRCSLKYLQATMYFTIYVWWRSLLLKRSTLDDGDGDGKPEHMCSMYLPADTHYNKMALWFINFRESANVSKYTMIWVNKYTQCGNPFCPITDRKLGKQSPKDLSHMGFDW